MKSLHVFTLFTTADSFFNGQYGFLTTNNQQIDVASADADASEFSDANGTRFFPIQIARSISPLTDLKSISQLRKLIQREKYDAVFGHTPKGAMVAMIAARLAGVKTRVYYRHGLIYTTAHGLKRKILKTVERLTSACATHIVNVSPSLSKLAVKEHLNPNKKQIVFGAGTCGGIDTINLFNPAKVSKESVSELKLQLNIHDDAFVAGFCGRLCRDKGILELIDGFRLFQQKHPDISAYLLLVGPYDARDVLPQQIKDEIEANDSIITTGSVPHQLLPAYYSLMDVFVFPSYREGFGMTVIEASAMEKPILVSRSHGCVDSIQENITGEYIALTADSIMTAMTSMLDRNKRLQYGANGRKWVTENFERTRMWPMVLDFYNQTLQAKPKRLIN